MKKLEFEELAKEAIAFRSRNRGIGIEIYDIHEDERRITAGGRTNPDNGKRYSIKYDKENRRMHVIEETIFVRRRADDKWHPV